MSEQPEPVMLSALEHYHYCPRQCALIHVEQTFDENIYTLKGQAVHARVDEPSERYEEGVRTERAMPLWSQRLNLVGKADLVEFYGDTPYPVEYKSGRKRRGEAESIQLCAQALCLEEMLGVSVPRGALFWFGSRERKEVVFTSALRAKTEAIAHETAALIASGKVPPPVNDDRCTHCSLRASCLPEAMASGMAREKLYDSLFDET
jgi:CRISPR-associated exonuclease Cas4